MDSILFAITFSIGLILAYIILYGYNGSKKKSTSVPGLTPSDPQSGNLSDIKKAGSFFEFIKDLHRKFGDIASFWYGKEWFVSIASPDLFAQHTKPFDRPHAFMASFEAFIGADSIEFANGEAGKMKHRLYSKSFSHSAVSAHYNTFQKIVNELIGKLSCVAPDEHVPLRENMFTVTIKAIAQTSFGEYFFDEEKVKELRKNNDICWTETEYKVLGGEVEPGSPRQQRFDKALEGLKKLLCEMLALRRKNPPEEGEELLIDVIIKSGVSDDAIFSDCKTFLVGGFHTTALLLTWCLYFLAKNQDVQEKLFEEISSILEGEDITPSILDQLKYTRQVIDETLRLSVLAPYSSRVHDEDLKLGGYIIPKNTPVLQSRGVIWMDEGIWENPQRFDPDRFSEARKSSLPKFAFEPFGFSGKRKCPGYRYTYAEAMVFIVSIIQKFRLDLVEGQVVTPVYGLVTTMEEEIYVTLHKRKTE